MVVSNTQPRFPDRNTVIPGGEAGATPVGCSKRLKVAPVGVKAARYAVEHWHYSGCLPAGKTFKVGVWEDDQFIGVVIFSRGANNRLGSRLGLPEQRHCVELTRIALDRHANPVTRIVRFALKEMRKYNPDVRAVISFADPEQGHHGGVYQGGGWEYIGKSQAQAELIVNGRLMHKRSAGSKYGTASIPKLQAMGVNAQRSPAFWKHTYAKGFDRNIKNRLRRMAKPAPSKMTA